VLETSFKGLRKGLTGMSLVLGKEDLMPRTAEHLHETAHLGDVGASGR
jgi:hypothetical protein